MRCGWAAARCWRRRASGRARWRASSRPGETSCSGRLNCAEGAACWHQVWAAVSSASTLTPPFAPSPRIFSCRSKLLEELGRVGGFGQQAACKHFLDQVDPTIR